ncbi:putative polypeptide N-acetylgalactosaminyltransferase 9 [Caerostris extrusa]|uniref:Polypeptide N-acetylgalactosaminyltransferase 9 n=1 Tax=Caerostris extrusa TaxID=172846 RepID=A0AAV4XAE3_CAEEX|nr:putative polypeptide N-acetylgalactosaminyltransferase 9 [Caerostris extrusa]
MILRRRNVILKGLVLIPATWIVVTYILAVTSNHSAEDNLVDKASQSKHKAERSLQQQPLAQHGDNSIDSKTKSKEPDYQHDDRDEGVLKPPSELEGYGEMGKPVKLSNLTEEQQKLVKLGWKNNAFNQYISDLISLHRTLPDPRDKECRDIKYPSILPQTSVIICFHNEAWSVLMRTVHSVLERSPDHLLKEIVLVDDFSDQRKENFHFLSITFFVCSCTVTVILVLCICCRTCSCFY